VHETASQLNEKFERRNHNSTGIQLCVSPLKNSSKGTKSAMPLCAMFLRSGVTSADLGLPIIDC